MGASGNAASKSDLTSLKNTVSSLQKKVTALETTTVDDKAIQGIVKNIDYLKLKDNIRMDDLSTEILKNPGAIADSVAQSFTKDTGKMETISKGLADNEKFAKTLADTLTDTSGKYRSGLRGEKGETGELSTSKDAVKAALYDKKYTMWCADGGVCKMPAGVPTLEVGRIKIGDWFLEQHPGGSLHVHRGDVNDWYSSHGTNKTFHGRNLWSENWLHAENGHVNGRHIVNDMNNLYNFADNIGVRRDRQYYIRSNRGGLLIDAGGWSSNKGDWETMKFEQK